MRFGGGGFIVMCGVVTKISRGLVKLVVVGSKQ